MAYQLDWLQTLELFMRDDFWHFLLIIGIVMILALKLTKNEEYKYRLLIKVTVVGTAFSIITIVGYCNYWLYNSGWQLRGDLLYIKSYGFSEEVRIKSMHIGFVQKDSKWWPRGRNVGADRPELFVGQYTLNNNVRALLFNRYNQNELLLIAANNKYYLIGHPGVKVLYWDLLKLGAKEKNFGR